MLRVEIFPVFLRFLFGGSAVVVSTLIAKNFGGRLGGIFAAFPAVYLASVLGLSMDYNGSELLLVSEQLSKGALVGMIADVCCALAASYFILRSGWKRGLVYALLLWAVLAPTIYFTWFRF
ncbi:DUF3147 family protein [Methanosarcina sp. MSH10X1]|uniref:DUF3147 family protein n=1 Tax=Methanosarcina sp. MSH10X1 TaxID=2507075 RepID=UPI000FFB29B2|nr:DUF3147 family protein [Methanosarcina sp. MSH10X1]RXA21852.1 DUF3147 family protein [Methanosarcina sp. MSH10X1]